MRVVPGSLLALAIYWVVELGLEALVVSPRWSSAPVDMLLFAVGMWAPYWFVFAGVLAWQAVRNPRQSGAFARGSVALVVLLSLISGDAAANHIRMAGMSNCASRLDALVKAISAFEREHGSAPIRLEDLTPHPFSTLPQTATAVARLAAAIWPVRSRPSGALSGSPLRASTVDGAGERERQSEPRDHEGR